MNTEVSPEVNVLLKVCKQKDEVIERAQELITERQGEIGRLEWKLKVAEDRVDRSQLEKYIELYTELRKEKQTTVELRNENRQLRNDLKKWRYNIAEAITDGWIVCLFILLVGVVLGWLLL